MGRKGLNAELAGCEGKEAKVTGQECGQGIQLLISLLVLPKKNTTSEDVSI